MSEPAEPSRLSRRTVGPGSRIDVDRVDLTWVYSDNYLWLLPAESRDIGIDCATTGLGGRSPAVQVTASGATPTTAFA